MKALQTRLREAGSQLFVDCVKPPLRCAAAGFAVKIDFEPRSLGGLELEPVTLEIVIAAIALGGAPTSHDERHIQEPLFKDEDGRHRRFASGCRCDEDIT